MGEQVPSKELFPGEPTAPWDRKDLAGPPLNESAWNYELRSYYERWQRGARDEIENLRRENVRWENAHKILLSENERLRRPAHERESPHCSTCSCGMQPEPPREYPDPVTAFENLAAALPEGFQFPTMEPSTEPLTHQEIFSAVHHHASEIARLTAAIPAQCKPETTGESERS